MDVLLSKIISLLGILLFSILFGIAPLFLEKCMRSPRVHWINNAIICFSGGTLLGISFLHLMPETREAVHKLVHEGHFSSVPPQLSLADVVICGGFFFIYILDEVIHVLLELVGADHSHQPHGRRTSLVDSHSYTPANTGETLKTSKDEATSTVDVEEGNGSHMQGAIHIPSILTIVALSFHDIFEGLALGIQEYDTDVMFLFLSIATHKYAIAFSVSLDLLLSGVSARLIVVYTVCFSLVNPVGTALGIVLSHLSDEGSVESPMTVIMQGIASGSLIYVVCFEVLQRHASGHGSHAAGIRNTLFVFLGYIFILVMKILNAASEASSLQSEAAGRGGSKASGVGTRSFKFSRRQKLLPHDHHHTEAEHPWEALVKSTNVFNCSDNAI